MPAHQLVFDTFATGRHLGCLSPDGDHRPFLTVHEGDVVLGLQLQDLVQGEEVSHRGPRQLQSVSGDVVVRGVWRLLAQHLLVGPVSRVVFRELLSL